MIKLYLDTTVAKKAVVTISESEKGLVKIEEATPVVAIEKALQKANLELKEIDQFTANPGPGSYTGIRVGAAVVNALNFAFGKTVQPIEPVYE